MAEEKKSEGIYGLWKENVPSDYRWYLQTLFGEKGKPFTEKDLTKKELQAIDKQIKDADEYGLRRLKQESENKQNYLDSATQLQNNAKAVNTMAAQDSEWQEYGQLDRMRDELGMIPEKHRARASELFNKLKDRYWPYMQSESVLALGLGQNPDKVNSLFASEYKRYTKNDQLNNAIKEKAALDNKIENYANRVGNVQYTMDPNKELNTLGGDAISQTLGRYNYKKLPDGKVQVIDNYDFSNDSRQEVVQMFHRMQPVEKAVNTAKYVGKQILSGDPAGAAGVAGMAYIGDEGRPVNVMYDPKEIYKKSGGTIEMPAEYSNGKWKLI
jgi:hypothetical protein